MAKWKRTGGEIPAHIAAYAAGLATGTGIGPTMLAEWVAKMGMGVWPAEELAEAADRWLKENVSLEMRLVIEAMIEATESTT